MTVADNWKGVTIGKFLTSIRKYFAPILIIALVVCIVALLSSLDIPERGSGIEADNVIPIIVAEVTPAEPVQQIQSSSYLPPHEDVPPIEVPEGVDIFPEEMEALQEEEPATVTPTNEETVVKSLVSERQEKLDQRNTELEDMKSMLVLLEQQNDDPERIALYYDLIAKTEKEIVDLEKDIVRYSSTLKE